MTEVSPVESAPSGGQGIVCSACGGNKWRITQTKRRWWGVIRRWRTCLGCGHRIRTVERIEADPHPDRDAA